MPSLGFHEYSLGSCLQDLPPNPTPAQVNAQEVVATMMRMMTGFISIIVPRHPIFSLGLPSDFLPLLAGSPRPSQSCLIIFQNNSRGHYESSACLWFLRNRHSKQIPHLFPPSSPHIGIWTAMTSFRERGPQAGSVECVWGVLGGLSSSRGSRGIEPA